MLMVEPHIRGVDARLRGGELECPSCSGELRPWGFARARTLRRLAGTTTVRPRRSRCRACSRTHVLLPVSTLLRRMDVAQAIGRALVLGARGWGHRRIAARYGRPPTTVREWLRRFARRAEAIRAHFTALAYRLDPSLGDIAPRASPTADAVEAIAVAHRAAVTRLGPSPVWAFCSGATAGLLLANTTSPFPAPW